jgi:maltose O-acetyltransferase
VDYFNPDKVQFGSYISINKGVFFNISSSLIIGNNVTISANVFITTVGLDLDKWPKKYHKSSGIVVGDNVWIGAGSILLPGVKLAEGSIVGAGAVVTKDTEPYCVYAGVPAKKISGPIKVDVKKVNKLN